MAQQAVWWVGPGLIDHALGPPPLTVSGQLPLSQGVEDSSLHIVYQAA